MSILDDIRNSLAEGGIYNSPDGKYSIIGGGDANTPGLPRVFAGAPRILVSGGGSANGVVPFEILSAFPLAPQGEQQNFAQQRATYAAGEGKAPTFGDAALAAVGSYFGGQALGGMLGGTESALSAGVGGIDSGTYPYGMGPQGTGIGTGNPYMFAGEVPAGSLGTGTVNNLGGGLDISGGLDAPGGFYSTPVEVQPGFDPNNIAGQATYGESMSSALRNPFGLGAAGTGLAAQLSGAAGEAVGAGAASGIIPQLMAATGLSASQLAGLGAAGISSLTSLYGASQIGKAATTAANIGQGAADRATALQREQYDQTRADLAPYRMAGTNALAQLTAGTAPGGQFTKSFGMSDFQQDPGYGFRMSEGLKALDRTAAARGGLLSGATLKGAQRYGQNLGSQEYQNAFNRYQTNRSNLINPLQSLAGVGQTSTNQGISAGQNFATNVGNLGMGAASNQADAGLAAARSNQSAYGAIGNAFSNYLSPNPMNTFFQNQLNKNPVA